MSDIAIQVQGLSKLYQIGRRKAYKTARESMMSAFTSAGRLLAGGGEADPATQLWALKDISFDVNRGEVIGIIGRNGAGKSTLLKVLSRITEPTTGRIALHGRVGSLLEVGTGFHPELTGRENIYLNGAILGMRQWEISKKFDEIVDFAEVDQFIDTPVKRYSSGMYTRLAFAVAANLEPEILVVDEVLAVGDVQFQKKCLGKMKDVARGGRTVLFVSHNMRAVEQLCGSVVLLEHGRIKTQTTDVAKAIRDYSVGADDDATVTMWKANDPAADQPLGNNFFKPTRFFLSDATGQPLPAVLRGDSDIWLQVEGDIESLDSGLGLGYALSDANGVYIYWSYHTDTPESDWPALRNGKQTLRTKLPRQFLPEGRYRIELAASLYYRDWILEPGKNSPSIGFEILGGVTNSPYWMGRHAVTSPILPWTNAESGPQ